MSTTISPKRIIHISDLLQRHHIPTGIPSRRIIRQSRLELLGSSLLVSDASELVSVGFGCEGEGDDGGGLVFSDDDAGIDEDVFIGGSGKRELRGRVSTFMRRRKLKEGRLTEGTQEGCSLPFGTPKALITS